VVILFTCGLMAKPMLVTLPFVLIILDFWPLERVCRNIPRAGDAGCRFPQVPVLRSFVEKLPLLLLSAVSCAVTFHVQHSGGAVARLDNYTLPVNAANAVVSYVRYIGRMLWPADLAIFYPHPGNSLPWWQVAGALLLLVITTMLAIRLARCAPYFLAGWLWYLGTMVPVIGMVRVGSQAMADRYTYVPMIGLFIAITWAASELAAGLRRQTTVLAFAGTVVLSLLSWVTWGQITHWKDSISLFRRAVAVTEKNPLAHNMLGAALMAEGKTDEAAKHYQEALRISPEFVKARYNLGVAYATLGATDEAIDQFRSALALGPGDPDAHVNLGAAYAKKGLYEQAIAEYHAALDLNPESPLTHYNLGVAYKLARKPESAIDQFRMALRLRPDDPDIRLNLGQACMDRGLIDQAVEQYQQVLRLRPDDANLHNILGMAMLKMGHPAQAAEEFRTAVRQRPFLPEFSSNLRRALAQIKGGAEPGTTGR